MENIIDKKLFGERLKTLMKNFNETTYSLGKKFNLSPPTISRYTRGEMQPKMTTITALSNYFNVSPNWLAGIGDSIYDDEILDDLTNDQKNEIPIFKNIKYDLPIFSNQKTEEKLKVSSTSMAKWGAFFSCIVPDNSMAPTLEANDQIIIKLNPKLESHGLAALHVNQSDLIIRRVIIKDNKIILQPDNLEYEAEVYNLNKDNIQIIGNVVYKKHTEEKFFEE